MSPSPELRPIEEDSYSGFVRNLDRTFGFDYDPEEDSFRPLIEFDRSFGHFDGDRVVSTISAFSLEMSVPGSSVPCGGTTVITVSPTHRRQGLLTEMMGRHLDDIQSREEPIAALWASESEIYGRFGYGRATQAVEITVHGRGHGLAREAPEPAPVRMIEEEDAREQVPPYHDKYRLRQPGMFARTEPWWDNRIFNDLPSRRQGHTAARWVIVDGDDEIDGYARYRVKGAAGDDGHSASELRILELFATTPQAWAGLWSFLISQDLTVKFVAPRRSPEDPIFDLLAGPRRAQAAVTDGIWVRVMDVPRALQARSYQSDFAGTIKVHDPMGRAGGTFHLETSPDGATCQSGSGEADIELDLEDLGSVYLGRTGFQRMARAGRLTGDPGVLRSADQAFAWSPEPWCPEVF